MLNNVTYTESAYDCAKGADVLVIVTEWEQFRALDLAALKAAMAKPVIVDLRNIYPPEDMAKHGFTYTGRRAGLVLKAVMAGHSRSKNGVASLAY